MSTMENKRLIARTSCILQFFGQGALIIFQDDESKEGKDQESIISSTTPDPGHGMAM